MAQPESSATTNLFLKLDEVDEVNRYGLMHYLIYPTTTPERLIPIKDKENHEPGFMMRLMQAKGESLGCRYSARQGRLSSSYRLWPAFYGAWLYGAECGQLKVEGYKDDANMSKKLIKNIILPYGYKSLVGHCIKTRIRYSIYPKHFRKDV
ncbi:MAG: hypothetical protein U0Z17_06955 [Bacteroidales bacterium]